MLLVTPYDVASEVKDISSASHKAQPGSKRVLRSQKSVESNDLFIPEERGICRDCGDCEKGL